MSDDKVHIFGEAGFAGVVLRWEPDCPCMTKDSDAYWSKPPYFQTLGMFVSDQTPYCSQCGEDYKLIGAVCDTFWSQESMNQRDGIV